MARPSAPLTDLLNLLRMTPRASLEESYTAGKALTPREIRRTGPTDPFLSKVMRDHDLINPRNEAGTIEMYMANRDHEAAIIAQIEDRVRQGVLPRKILTGVKKSFADASRTQDTANRIQDLVDSQYPARYPGIDRVKHEYPPGLLDKSRLDEFPEDMPLSPKTLLLPVPENFDFETFASRTTPQRIRTMRRDIENGAKDIPSALSWYNTKPIRDKFVEVLGPQGQKSFKDLMGHVSLSSPESAFPINMLRGTQLRHFQENNLPLPTSEEMAASEILYGHRHHNLILESLRRLTQGIYPIKSAQSPKTPSFFNNNAGNPLPVTVDRHGFNAAGQSEVKLIPAYGIPPGMKQAKGVPRVPLFNADGTPKMHRAVLPLDENYTPLEMLFNRLAQQSRILPDQAQSALWVGTEAGPRGGVSAMSMPGVTETFEDMVMRSARAYDEDPYAHMIRIIEGKVIPRRAEGGPVKAVPREKGTNYWEEKPPSPSWSVPKGALGRFFQQRQGRRQLPPNRYPDMATGVRG